MLRYNSRHKRGSPVPAGASHYDATQAAAETEFAEKLFAHVRVNKTRTETELIENTGVYEAALAEVVELRRLVEVIGEFTARSIFDEQESQHPEYCYLGLRDTLCLL